MITLVTLIHITTSLLLIVIVLMQSNKGAEIGAVFGGGGSHTAFGSSGANKFMIKLTATLAVIFMVTSLYLAVRKKPTSVIKEEKVSKEEMINKEVKKGEGIEVVQPKQEEVEVISKTGEKTLSSDASSNNTANSSK
ncbi:MAG: preprotein translocase subunit SecG [bacterium]